MRPSFLLFFFFWGSITIALAVCAGLLFHQHSEQIQYQAAIEEQQIALKYKGQLEQEIDTLTQQIKLLEEIPPPTGTVSETEQNHLTDLQKIRTERRQAHSGLIVSEHSSYYTPLLEASYQSSKRLISVAIGLSLTIALPCLIAVPQYSQCAKLVTPNTPRRTTFFHSLPGVNVILYSYLSALWNIEGTQRKNSLLITIPLSLAALCCIGLTLYHANRGHFHWVATLTLCLTFWGGLHYRQLQMLRYAETRKNRQTG